jgi:hypothetical protein
LKIRPGKNIPVELIHKVAKQDGVWGREARMALRYREANKKRAKKG